MAVSITTEHGTFQADTIRDAEKLANKAKRAADKAHTEREAKREVARVRADAKGFMILRAKVQQQSFPSAWRFVDTSHTITSVQCRQDGKDYGEDTLTVETADAKGEMKAYRNSYRGYIEGGNGYTIAIVLDCGGDALSIFSVGTYDGEAAAAHVPCVKLEEFKASSRNESEAPAA